MESFLLRYIKQNQKLCYFSHDEKNIEFWLPKDSIDLQGFKFNKLKENQRLHVKIPFWLLERKGLI